VFANRKQSPHLTAQRQRRVIYAEGAVRKSGGGFRLIAPSGPLILNWQAGREFHSRERWHVFNGSTRVKISGDNAIEFRRFDQLPPKFRIVNLTGAHDAELVVEDYSGSVISRPLAR
jgi:hypothetical protein